MTEFMNVQKMTYGRSRLWLGITGVGSLVALSIAALVSRLPHRFLSGEQGLGFLEVFQIGSVIGIVALTIAPLDFLGGYWLPTRHQKSNQKLGTWFKSYVIAAIAQMVVFTIFGSLIIASSVVLGILGACVVIVLSIFACFFVRNWWVLRKQINAGPSTEKLLDAITLIQSWQTFVPRTVVVDHNDIGFTGGIIGLGKHASIIIPKAWLSLSREELAIAIARRSNAINSGSYTRGILFAFFWNLFGFVACTFVPGAGLTSVAELVTNLCAFTVWSFFGLLTLPTISRNASLQSDVILANKGVPKSLISAAARKVDQMQDGEPDRPKLIETIFHPVPNVSSRNHSRQVKGFTAWNVARTTLFFSWACLGFLSRAVHCNVGRPELWTMLPSD